MLFEQINVEYDTTPIVLIDKSGSTSSGFGNYNYSTNEFDNCVNTNVSDDEDSEDEMPIKKHNVSGLQPIKVLQAEIKKAVSDLRQIGINSAYVMFWNDRGHPANDEKIMQLTELDNHNVRSDGGTTLATSLRKIPESWLNSNKQVTDIYIYTDGEVSDDKDSLQKELLKLFSLNVRIFICTIENNNRNYIDGNCQAGNNMYKVIQNCGMTSRVKKFTSYNRYHLSEPFVSLNNPDVPLGYAPFQDSIFKVTEINKFMCHLEGHISNIQNDNEMLKLTHELSLTVSHLIKGKSHQIQRRTIDMFCDLFSETAIYTNVREMLLNEIDNHAHGKATTFQGYKRNREKVFENAQLSLYENVKKSISIQPNQKYASMIMNSENGSVVIKTSADKVCEPIVLSDKTYRNGGFLIGKYRVPMLPLQLSLDHDEYDQCVRQWIRANYAKRYGINAASDLILYYFLADAMRIFLSDVSPELIASYKALTYLMLDRKRFGTTLTELDYLMTNPPAPVIGAEDKINYMLVKTMKYLGMSMTETAVNEETGKEYQRDVGLLKPFTFWYAFILAFGDKNLVTSQLPFCEGDMVADLQTPETLLQTIKTMIKPVLELDCSGISTNYDYTCYLTLEDTSDEGGYLLPSHRVTKKISCSPNMVLSKEGFQSLVNHYNNGNEVKCPICCAKIDMHECQQVLPRHILEEIDIKNAGKALPVLDEPFYDLTNYEKVNIEEHEYKEDDNQILISLDSYNFNTVSYSINAPYIQEPLGTRSIEIKTQEEFNRYVQFKYPFLSKINFDGLCLAGGFCRSVLLKQRLKDFDFFIHSEEGKHEEIFYRALSESMHAIKEMHPNTKFLIMYKHLFNVYEVVCISDPNNFFKENYTLDNFKQYGFRSLHKFDKDTVINPETGKIMRRKYGSHYEKVDIEKDDIDIENRDFSNYFEDGDVSGIKMHYRLQFILSRNNSIEDVFQNFDFYQCRVAWDGKTTWFTEKSAKAYKYMINIINEKNYSDLFDYRMAKYFTYGFSIVMPELDLKKLQNKSILNLGKNTFNISQVSGNCVMVEHNSHIANQLASLEALEKKSSEKDGKALYKSSLFCSLVSLLRYVKINDVSYLITGDIVMPTSEGYIKFQESEENVKFIDRIQTRIDGHDYYGNNRLGSVENIFTAKKRYVSNDSDSDDTSDSESDTSSVVSVLTK